MAVHQRHRETAGGASDRIAVALGVLADAGAAVAAAPTLATALQRLADAIAAVVAADLVVIRVRDGDDLSACAVASRSTAVAAELEATRVPAADLQRFGADGAESLSPPTRRAAVRLRAEHAFVLPVGGDEHTAGSIEVARAGDPFDDSDRRLVTLAAAQTTLAIRALGVDEGVDAGADSILSLAGDALVAVTDEDRTGDHVTRLAVEATGALAGLLWRAGDESVALAASFGLGAADGALVDAGEAAERALRGREPVQVEQDAGRLPLGAGVSATLQLGQPPIGALQLLFPARHIPADAELVRLRTFGVRAAQALRAGLRTRAMAAELDRTRALLDVVGQAISQLSLAHTLETAVVSVGELLGVERLAVYLKAGDRLLSAAGLGLAGPHVRVAERLLELALGPFRGRGVAAFADVAADPRLASVGDAAAEAGIEGAVAVPLLARGEMVGLLAVFPPRARPLTPNETTLLSALATQLAVAVQNAQLHEQATQLGDERERALDAERASARQLRALYEISRSFAQSLSLDATLEAVARTVTEVLDVDVAVIRMPDERQEAVVARALNVTDARADEAVRTVVGRDEPFGAPPWQRLFRLGESFRLTREMLEQIGPSAVGMIPFVERGWSGAAVPVATTADVVASLTIVSLRPDAPISADTIERAEAIAGQAALAIDNARLYQQQKEFADTMQRSLLPRSVPELGGLEVGDAYQSSARVEVGGDVYDFIALDDGRLAVVLGDVTGHGIEAAADMAMAKFVFRSLAREHPEPHDFLATANDVVVGEIAPGKFITMAYLVVDPQSGTVAGAGAGHPPPRVVTPDGDVRPLEVRGLVLGIEPAQTYAEERTTLEIGGAVVLYTDGVLEARLEGELYGFERLDAIVSAGRHLSAQDLAETILADCRDFAKNELADDCAVVVIKRVAE